ncbi:hypothetical protein M5K25_021272 [Dendrobium thyrsiflorum]|uniref:Uncharacterized protein n=1 Tax=Dendrobium thyrsiflorum TaxID=117978 RepID=A0ABD0UBY2_DENTH
METVATNSYVDLASHQLSRGLYFGIDDSSKAAMERNLLAISVKLGLSVGSADQHCSINAPHSGSQESGTVGLRVYHHKLKTGVWGNEDEPDQDPMVPSSRAVVFPGHFEHFSNLPKIWLSPEFLRKIRQPSGVPSPAPGGKEGICPFKSARPER